MNPYFIWKGESSEDHNIIINKLPNVIRPTERVNKVVVDGRNGYLLDSYGTYDGVIKSCECTLDHSDNLDYICNWLTGSDVVVFSNEPDKAYQARIINSIPFSKIVSTLSKIIIQFDCQPLKLSLNEFSKTLLAPTSIRNYGTIGAEPIITVYGSGDVTLSVNDNLILLKDISSYMVVNTVIMDAYKDDTLLNNKMVGEFPYLKPGNNSITWTGNVTKIEIKYRERYI